VKRPANVILLALLLGASAAAADTLVCKQGRTVQPGMTAEEVRQKCGPPTFKESRTEDVRAVNRGYAVKVGEIVVETWRYDRGSQKPAAILVVKEGKIVSIAFEH
jgi:hypothetical protein